MGSNSSKNSGIECLKKNRPLFAASSTQRSQSSLPSLRAPTCNNNTVNTRSIRHSVSQSSKQKLFLQKSCINMDFLDMPPPCKTISFTRQISTELEMQNAQSIDHISQNLPSNRRKADHLLAFSIRYRLPFLSSSLLFGALSPKLQKNFLL